MHFLNFGLLCYENQGQIPWNSKEDEATQKRKEKQAFYSVTNFFGKNSKMFTLCFDIFGKYHSI